MHINKHITRDELEARIALANRVSSMSMDELKKMFDVSDAEKMYEHFERQMRRSRAFTESIYVPDYYTSDSY